MMEKIRNILSIDKDVLRRRAYFYYMLDEKSNHHVLSEMLWTDEKRYLDKIEHLEDMFARYIGADHAILTGSGGNSLQIVLKCLDIKPDTKVFLQAYTCSILKDIISRYAVPQFVDTDVSSYNADMKDFERKIVPRSVILAIHNYGNPMNPELMSELAEKKNSIIIEDCAHALGAAYKGRKVGTSGKASIFSLRKNIAVGGGGFIATNDDRLAEKMLKERNLCQKHRFMARDFYGECALLSRHLFKMAPTRLSGLYNLYSKNRPDCNSVLPSLLDVSIALDQLRRIDGFMDDIQRNARYISKRLKNNANFVLPEVGTNVLHAYTRYPVRFANLERHSADDVCKDMFRNGFETGMNYRNDFVENIGGMIADYPKSDMISKTMVPLGLMPNLKKEDLDLVVDILERYAK